MLGEPTSAATVSKCLLEFAQNAFGQEAHVILKRALVLLHAEEVFARLRTLDPLTAEEAQRMTPEQQRVLYEIITQYIQFTTVFDHLRFPPSFLDGSSRDILPASVLRYFAEHRWPFPQLLPQ